jgi:hypothetical protein
MTQSKTVVVDRDDLESAFEFVSSVAPSEHSASISLADGRIRLHSVWTDMGDDDDPEEEDEDSISVPHKNELGLGRRLVMRFVEQEMPDDYDTVADIFRRRGAYARYKDLLQQRRMLERWYKFEDDAMKAGLRAWCEANDIQLADELPVAAPD